jgi:hypothetical protein
VARDLDNDAEGVNIACLGLLQYARAKNAFDDSGDKAEERGFTKELIDEVRSNTFAIKKRRREEKGKGDGGNDHSRRPARDT